jgi:hypothetical protein
MDPDFVKKLGCISLYQCGSTVTCDPPPENTDEDWLVLVHTDQVTNIDSFLNGDGFLLEGGEHYQWSADNDFSSYRKDNLNILVTSSKQFYARHVRATALCKRLNLMDKEERIALFRTILYEEMACEI